MPVKIDIIILSYAKNQKLKDLTLQAVKTLVESEDLKEIQFEILVIESNKSLQPYQFKHTTTIYPADGFGFNKYLNIGIKHTANPYVCLCNNDLIFHKGWATEILNAMAQYPNILSANPYANIPACYEKEINDAENIIFRQKNLTLNGVLTGWCIFVKREIFDIIGPLDEQFEFWYADNDYDNTLKKFKIEHALVKSSIVEHIAMQSHDHLKDTADMTFGQKKKFDNKWGKRSLYRRVLTILHQMIRPQPSGK